LSIIRDVIMQEINDLATNGVTPDEMQKIQNQLLNDVIRMRQSSMARAQHIAEYALYDGNPELVNTELDELLQVTPEQIKAAAAEFLHTENRALLDVVPVGKG